MGGPQHNMSREPEILRLTPLPPASPPKNKKPVGGGAKIYYLAISGPGTMRKRFLDPENIGFRLVFIDFH